MMFNAFFRKDDCMLHDVMIRKTMNLLTASCVFLYTERQKKEEKEIFFSYRVENDERMF